jgi:hypothetical protein
MIYKLKEKQALLVGECMSDKLGQALCAIGTSMINVLLHRSEVSPELQGLRAAALNGGTFGKMEKDAIANVLAPWKELGCRCAI